MITEIQELEIPCFQKKKLESEMILMKSVLKEIEELINDLPRIWKSRYSTKNYDLEIRCNSLGFIAHKLEQWRQDTMHIDEERFIAIQKAQIKKLNQMFFQDGEGHFYSKENCN